MTGRDARGCCPLPTAWGLTVLEPVPRQAHPERMRDRRRGWGTVPFPALAGRRPLT